MTTYQTKSVTTKEASTAYTSELDSEGNVLVHVDGGVVQQKTYADKDLSPGDIDGTLTVPLDKYTSIDPRFGENTATRQPLPPVFIYQKKNQPTPVIDPNGPLRFLHNEDAHFFVSSRLWILKALHIQTFSDSISLTAVDTSPELESGFNATKALLTNTKITTQTFDNTPDPTAQLEGDTFIFGASITVESIGSLSGNLNTVVFVDGDITITEGILTPNNGAYTVVIATGHITITGTTSMNINDMGATVGSLILIAGKDIGYSYTSGVLPSPMFHENVLIGAGGNLTIASDMGAENITSALHLGTTEIAPSPTFVPHDLSIDLVVYHDQHRVVPSGYYDMWGTTAEVLNNTGVSVKNISMVALTQSINVQECLDAFHVILAAQFNLGFNAFTTVINTALNNATQEIRFLYNGKWRETMIVLQKHATNHPNIGIHTEPFGFDKYIENMAQSYRVADGVYALFSDGRYMTIPAGEWKVRISSANIGLPTLPYQIDQTSTTTMTIDKVASLKIVDAKPTDPPNATTNEGGMDPFDAAWESTYRALTEGWTPSTETLVRIKAPYSSFIRYAPLGGHIVNDSTGEITDTHILVKNTSRHSRLQRRTITVQPTSQDGASLIAGMNVAAHYNATQTDHQLVYADTNTAHIWFNQKLYKIPAGDANTDATVIPGYGNAKYLIDIPNSNGTLEVLNGNDVISSELITLVAPPATITVVLEILFGDMFGDSHTTVTETEEEFEYYFRTIEGLFFSELPTNGDGNGNGGETDVNIYGQIHTVDISDRTQDEIDALILAGFHIDGDTATRFTQENDPIKVGNFTVYGRRLARYTTGATTAKVPIADGMYGEILVLEGMVQVSALPFNIGLYTYVGFEEEPVPSQPPNPYHLEITATAPIVLGHLQSDNRTRIVGTDGVAVQVGAKADASGVEFKLITGLGTLYATNGFTVTKYNVTA
jgi:hypothetical protein